MGYEAAVLRRATKRLEERRRQREERQQRRQREIYAQLPRVAEIDRQLRRTIVDIIAASLLLCQPSKNESFSIVIMESWLCGRPALVHQDCEVTRHFAQDANGGLYFSDYMEFEGCVDHILTHPEEAKIMGANGCRYVKEHFDWSVVVKKYTDFFKSVIEKDKQTGSR